MAPSRSARSASVPDRRGKGYAAFLVAWLVRKLRAERSTPFLHVFTDNPAIALYERLGFRTRKTLRLTVLGAGKSRIEVSRPLPRADAARTRGSSYLPRKSAISAARE